MSTIKFLIIFIVFVASIAIKCDEIPKKYWEAPDISEHPHIQLVFPKFCRAGNKSEIVNILGGDQAKRGQFPFYALIFIAFQHGSVYKCGGALITQDTVISAAHCFYYKFQYLHIYFGVVNTKGPYSWATQIWTQESVKMHPNYIHNRLLNDIAVIKLSNVREDLLDDPYVGIVDLPIDHMNFNFVGQKGLVAGLGRYTDNLPNLSPQLRYVELTIIPNKMCRSAYTPGSIRETNLCVETSITEACCSGDSGSPLTVELDEIVTMVGIVSFGAQIGCQYGYPVAFTRITNYIGWIEDWMISSSMTFSINAILIALTQILFLCLWT